MWLSSNSTDVITLLVTKHGKTKINYEGLSRNVCIPKGNNPNEVKAMI